jgi:hypothetical protein
MSILQISKIQQRSGNLVDLPQLDEAEFGWASDSKRLFIGKTTPNENIEVLTGYSKISFDQLDGAVGNLNISNLTVGNGQVLAYDGTDWVNRGGTAGGLLTLGNVSNVKITGGAIGYVLATDGLGNLSWTPKGALYVNVTALSNANPIVMTVSNTTPYTNDTQVTITGVQGASNTIVNGQTFYVRLNTDFATSGNVKLYTSAGAVGPVNGAGLTYTNSPNAIATSTVGGSGGGSANAGGSNTTIQFNNNNLFGGDSSLTFDFGASTKVLALNGNANVGNLNANGTVTSTRFISNIATGTAPLVVTSTTTVANLAAATATSATTAGTVTTAAQPNITSVGLLANLNAGAITINGTTGLPAQVSGQPVITGSLGTPNIGALYIGDGTGWSFKFKSRIGSADTDRVTFFDNGNVTLNTGVITGNGSGLSAITGANVSGAVSYATTANAVAGANVTGQVGNALVAGTVYIAAQPNITSVGTLTSLTVSGSANFATSSGNVGIGTSSPISKLTVQNTSAGDGITVRSTGFDTNKTGATNALLIGADSSTGIGYVVSGGSSSNTQLAFYTAAAAAPVERMRLDSFGNLGIGTVPAYKLDVSATGTISGRVKTSGALNAFYMEDAGTTAGTLYIGSVGNDWRVVTGSNERLRVDSAGNVGIGTGSPTQKLDVNGNANVGNLSAAAGVFTANVTAGNIYANSGTIGASLLTGTVTTAAQPNITSVSTSFTSLTFTNAQTISGNNMTLTTGANTNAGTITGNWTLSAGSKLQATYADLAEYYSADHDYSCGTVVEFGGEKEVTMASHETTRVAGVISTTPAYLMNAQLECEYAVPVALSGRVPCKVRGIVRKGDMMVSAGLGYAKASSAPSLGSVIGKALADFDGAEGVIEVVVGRL